MNKRVLKLFMLLLLAIILAAACGSEKPTKEVVEEVADKPQLSQAELAQVQESVMNGTELTLYHPSMTTEEFVTIYGKSIVEKYPGIKIAVLNSKDGKIEDLILTGTNIDIIGGIGESFITTMKNMDVTSDLSDLMKKHNYDLSLWDPTVAKFIQDYNGGEITSIPHTIQTLALYYNKDLFSKFGVPFPTDNLSWDDIQEMNKKLTRYDGGVLYWGYDTRNAPNLFSLNQLSLLTVDPATNRAAFDTEPMKGYMSKLVDVVTSHGLEMFSGPGNQLDLFVKEQRLAMVSTMNTNFRLFDNPNVDWDIAKFPTLKELPDIGPQPQIPMYFVPGNSKNLEAAFLALAAITSPEAQRELAANGRVSILRDPAMRSAFGTQLPELQGKNAEALVPDRYAEITPYSAYKGTASGELNIAYTAIINGTKDLNTAIREAVEATDKKIIELEEMNK